MNANADQDDELKAMSAVLAALQPLEEVARRRVYDWAGDRFGFQAPVGAAIPGGIPSGENPKSSTREGTINTVASQLHAESCRDLLVAAAAYLTLYQSKERFSKNEMVTAAKEAHAWKSDFSSQVATNLKRMQEASEIFEKSKEVYSLAPKKLKELEAQLAQ